MMLLSLIAGLTTNFDPMNQNQEIKDGKDASLQSRWEEYQSAYKSDKPLTCMEILKDIRGKAMERGAAWDFYESSVLYVEAVQRRDWKQRDTALAEFKALVQEFDCPIVTYKWMRNYGYHSSDSLFKYLNDNADRFKGKHNSSLWGSVSYMGGELKKYLADDYEFVLWDLFSSRQIDPLKPEKDEVYARMKEYLSCQYPLGDYLDYMVADKRYDDVSKKVIMEELSTRGRAVSFYPRSRVLEIEFRDLEKNSGSTSDRYKAIREKARAYESDRAALKGDEAAIAKPCTYPASLIRTLESSSINITAGGKGARVAFRNLGKATVTMYSFENDVKGSKIKTWKVKNSTGSFYVQDFEEIELPDVDDGAYILEAVSGKYSSTTAYRHYTISLAHRCDYDGHKVYAAWYDSGKPVEKATLALTAGEKKVLSSSMAFDGFTPVPEKIASRIDKDEEIYKTIYVQLRDENGKMRRSEEIAVSRPWEGSYNMYRNRTREEGRIFKDRGAYNPGDVLKFKVVLFKGNFLDDMAVLADTDIEVVLVNAESKEVERKKLHTGDFGSAAGEFTLPVGQRNGYFHLAVYNGSRQVASDYFRVDEFVLPSFSLEFDSQDRLYLPGERAKVSGKVSTYSGHSLGEAEINLKVKRYDEVVYETVTKPEGDGTFAVWFPASYSGAFEIEAIVADATGETLEFRHWLYISNSIKVGVQCLSEAGGSFVLKGEESIVYPSRPVGRRYPEYTEGHVLASGDTVSFKMEVRDASGNVVPGTVSYKIYDENSWKELQKDKNAAVEPLLGGEVQSGNTVDISLSALPSGLYYMRSFSEVEGKDIRSEYVSKILRVRNGILDAPVRRVFIEGDETVGPGGEIKVDFGCADGPLWAVVCLYGQKKDLLESRMVSLDGVRGETSSMTRASFEYKDSYPDAVRMVIFWFKYGHSISYDKEFHRRNTKLELPLSISSFTDKALPSTKYSVTLSSEPGTELLASVFDKSLDAISPNVWNLVRLNGVTADNIYTSDACGIITGRNAEDGTELLLKDDSDRDMVLYKSAAKGGKVLAAPMLMRENSAETMALADASASEESVGGVASDAEIAVADNVTVRENFETALAFEPMLRTGDNGQVSFEFETSEKLSTYYIYAYAHDKGMRNAFTSEEIVVSVPVKVSMLLPGYLYEGDELRPGVTVSNNSSEDVSGKLYLYVYQQDTPGLDASLKPVSVRYVPLSVPAGGSAAADFVMSARQKGYAGFKAVFVTEGFSDAMYESVPVNEALQSLTETHSAVLRAGMDEAKLIKQLRSRFKNVSGAKAGYSEISVLDMVRDAIPAKKMPAGKDVLSLSEAWYVRMLARRLDGSGADPSELLPKILACRNADGGFGWFEGMKSSRMITAVMLERMAKLAARGFDVPDMSSTVKYLDNTQFGEELPYWCGWVSDAQYMYVRSMYCDVPFDVKGDKERMKEFKEYAVGYLVPSEKDGRGLQGQILAKARRLKTLHVLSFAEGGVDLAEKWGIRRGTLEKLRSSMLADIESLSEYAVEHRDGGWYYPNAVMPWRGLMESEAYAHSTLCDLMSAVGQKKIADGIRLWLMLQKETQKWEDDPAYLDAITSIMDGDSDLLSTKVLVLKADYTAPFSKVKAAGNGFTIERRFFREVTVEEKYNDRTEEKNRQVSRLEEITPGMKVRRGEKIIARYVIWNQENRSFVRLNAFREATLRPVDQLSGHYGWWRTPLWVGRYSFSPQGYRDVKNDRTEYWFDSYPEENTTITEEFFVTQNGVFTAPVVEIESLYAPHYRANAGFTKPLATE